MKVFISWSGTTSHKVAKVFREWIPSVIQAAQPYVSSEDIDKGARWSSDIAAELDHSAYGLICLTKQNIQAPWINFEAGALGKSVDKSNVSPFLFRINTSDFNGPLLQYQSTKYDKEDIFKLMTSINACCGEQALEPDRLDKVFEMWWPDLKKSLDSIPEDETEATQPKQATSSKQADLTKFSSILEELLDLTRGNYQLLRTPETLLPADYLTHAIGSTRKPTMSDDAIEDLMRHFTELKNFVSTMQDNEESIILNELINSLSHPVHYIYKKRGSISNSVIRSRRLIG
ncbi:MULTISPECIES: TIR domain-containing protein [Enterobacteriaceae]|uniref:TIR domain-containing protein n=1 Tax=Enterobacteriaceae TaxID=543 RepID=UPI0022F0A6AC|nr:TIR domain-containing protein [Kosakonia pseudosacchari]MCS6023738.1 toll/interleukin-1 receptor domain-containing protein [Klebsiella pneumoniae subsp. pneumoniae]MEA4299766.1 TIR domain-containing protein [Klebsiella pneumoniae]HBQ3102184.1 toll/interleukin-1 receptor domain-containing protein [Klebsiella quasipneumoniae subsp. similipneumoniae]HCA9924517.1 toll/interleukin-1 receptor domain-containing protein [Klebsiella variicola subsp. variicola]WBU49968.1 TIR domain-containing protein